MLTAQRRQTFRQHVAQSPDDRPAGAGGREATAADSTSARIGRRGTVDRVGDAPVVGCLPVQSLQRARSFFRNFNLPANNERRQFTACWASIAHRRTSAGATPLSSAATAGVQQFTTIVPHRDAVERMGQLRHASCFPTGRAHDLRRQALQHVGDGRGVGGNSVQREPIFNRPWSSLPAVRGLDPRLRAKAGQGSASRQVCRSAVA